MFLTRVLGSILLVGVQSRVLVLYIDHIEEPKWLAELLIYIRLSLSLLVYGHMSLLAITTTTTTITNINTIHVFMARPRVLLS